MLDFLVRDAEFLYYVDVIDIVRFGQASKAICETVTAWVSLNREGCAAQYIPQEKKRKLFSRIRRVDAFVLWCVCSNICTFCGKPWYSYSRPRPLSEFAHEVCVFKRLKVCPQGEYLVPMRYSFFGDALLVRTYLHLPFRKSRLSLRYHK